MSFLSTGSSGVYETSSMPDFEVLFCWMCSTSLLCHETLGIWGLSLGSFQGFRVPVFYRQPMKLVWCPSFDGEIWPSRTACSSGQDGHVVPLNSPVPNAWRVLLPAQWMCLEEGPFMHTFANLNQARQGGRKNKNDVSYSYSGLSSV